MTRSRFLLFLFPLALLVVIAFESKNLLSENLTLVSRFIVGFLTWLVVWLRLDYQKRRREFALLPALPFFLQPINALLFVGPNDLGTDMPFYRILMILAWIGSAIVISMASLPDEKKPGERRLDAVSIVVIVFMCFFSMAFIIGHIGAIIWHHPTAW